jgi:hypothetical protein
VAGGGSVVVGGGRRRELTVSHGEPDRFCMGAGDPANRHGRRHSICRSRTTWRGGTRYIRQTCVRYW